MAHYALLDSDNIVTEVIVGKDELEDGIVWETYYSNMFQKTAKRTSYNTYNNQHLNGGVAFRGNYAGIGYSYDETRNAFIPPRPYDSWTLSETTFNWVPPVTYPDDGSLYLWDEDNQQWVADDGLAL